MRFQCKQIAATLHEGTYYDGEYNTGQPCLENDSKILLKVADYPSYASERQDDPIEDQLRKLLSFVVHGIK